jgi:hypothetical protein
MNRRLSALLAAGFIGWSLPAQAQLPDWVNQVLAAVQLPVTATQARNEGVADADIRAILDALKNSGVSPSQAVAIIDTTRAAHRDHGRVDNFGAFVQSQLAAGKRGRELAAAIRAEHARLGKGNPGRGKSAENPGRGRSGDNPGRGRGRPPGA